MNNMMDQYELAEIEEVVKAKIDNSLEEILSRLNRTEQLEGFLEMLGLHELTGNSKTFYSNDGKIVVIGQAEISEEVLRAVAKNDFSIDKERFEFVLDYDKAKVYDFGKMQYNEKYSCILVGPMPHSGKAKADYSSIITSLENKEGYPPVIRMGSNSLKITKTSFREALSYAKDNSIVA